MNNTNTTRELRKVQGEINKIENDISKLTDLYLDNTLNKDIFRVKYDELEQKLEKLQDKTRFIGSHFWNPPHIIPLPI